MENREKQKILLRYFRILEKKAKPKFQIAKKKGLLDKKINKAFEILENCEFCERKCHVDRIKSELGWCKVPNKILISSYFSHYGEEYFLVPSFTIFFGGCTFSCQYCQNWTISQRIEKSKEISERELANIIDMQAINCKNVNFVGGEPTPYLPFILKTLKYVDTDISIVWNSNFYMSERSMSLLKNIVDIYLSDFKYGNDKCARRLSKVENYTSIVRKNHSIAAKNKNTALVIRHLVLPSHIECCSKPILNWIAKNIKEKCIVNIMDQYRPEFNAYKYRKIDHFLKSEEFREVVNYAEKLKLSFIT